MDFAFRGKPTQLARLAFFLWMCQCAQLGKRIATWSRKSFAAHGAPSMLGNVVPLSLRMIRRLKPEPVTVRMLVNFAANALPFRSLAVWDLPECRSGEKCERVRTVTVRSGPDTNNRYERCTAFCYLGYIECHTNWQCEHAIRRKNTHIGR